METINKFESRVFNDIREPTIDAFIPLLEANRAKIQEVPRKTFQYGPTDRHQLDVYYPITPTTTGKSQILVWMYGGGFVSGQRRMPAPADLGYASVGSFFAHRGFIVVIPDYRLAPSTIFPGAAEDVRDAILWVIKNPQHLTTPTTPNPDVEGIFLMGHSAGAVHAFTSLLLPPTTESTVLLSSIAGLILHAGVYHFNYSDLNNPAFQAVVQHYGGTEYINERCPLGLLQSASPNVVMAMPRMLFVVAEKEPEWLLKGNEDFKKVVEASTGKKPASLVAFGHNHISPNWAVSSGQGETWAEEVVAWIRG